LKFNVFGEIVLDSGFRRNDEVVCSGQ